MRCYMNNTLNMLELLDMFIEGDITRLTSIISDRYESFLIFYDLWVNIPFEMISSVYLDISQGFIVTIELINSEDIKNILDILPNNNTDIMNIKSDNGRLFIEVFTF